MDHILGVGDVHDPAVQPVEMVALFLRIDAGAAGVIGLDCVVGARQDLIAEFDPLGEHDGVPAGR